MIVCAYCGDKIKKATWFYGRAYCGRYCARAAAPPTGPKPRVRRQKQLQLPNDARNK